MKEGGVHKRSKQSFRWKACLSLLPFTPVLL